MESRLFLKLADVLAVISILSLAAAPVLAEKTDD